MLSQSKSSRGNDFAVLFKICHVFLFKESPKSNLNLLKFAAKISKSYQIYRTIVLS